MKDVRLSVIIPIFNTGKYLSDCLDSVLAQEYRNLEIICVDDGSSDNSPSILQAYAQKDRRIILKTQDNHGPGYARNRALEIASGKYILFLDSDDKLETGIISKLAERADADKLDLLCFDLSPFFESELIQKKHPEMGRHHHFDYPGIFDGRELFTRMRQNNDYFSAGCLALYRREWLEEMKIRFPEGIFHEDEYFMFCCFLLAERAGFLPVRGYLRRLREGSTMTREKSLIHVRGLYRIANLVSETAWQYRDRLENYHAFREFLLEARRSPAYLLQNNRAQILTEALSEYDQMMVDDLDGYGSKEELNAVYASASWKVGNALIQPLHAVKKLFG